MFGLIVSSLRARILPRTAMQNYAELVAQGLRLVERTLLHRSLVENDLHETGTVAHVDENQSTVVAAAGYPAAEDDLSADVGFTQHAAVMRALHTF